MALDLEIGVDVEEIRPIADVMLIADHHLSQAERRDLWSLPPASRTAAFYAAWTRKEAVVKATDDVGASAAGPAMPRARRLPLSRPSP